MKYMFRIAAALAFILSGCSVIPQNGPAAPAGAGDAQTSTPDLIEVVGGDEESLREFIKQWIAPVSTDGTSQPMTVYIASLPKDLPYEVPTPDNTRLIGSISGGWVDDMLLFDTQLSPKSIHDFYAQRLAKQGWQEAPSNAGQGGFVSSADSYKGYCHDKDAFLSVETGPVSQERTSIRISLDVDPPSYNCDPSAVPSGALYEKLMPQLEAPSGTVIQSGGASSSAQDAEITAHLRSDRSPLQLVEFYNQQLVASGWKLQDSGSLQGSDQGEGAAWSHWTLTDEQGEPWLGSLMVLKTSSQNNKMFALLRIEKDN